MNRAKDMAKVTFKVGDVVSLCGDEITSMTVIETGGIDGELVVVGWLDNDLHFQRQTVIAAALRVWKE